MVKNMLSGSPQSFINHYQDDILAALGRYYFLTAKQIARAYRTAEGDGLRRAQMELTKLHRGKYIQVDNFVRDDPSNPGRPHPVYTLTDTGRRYLQKQGKILNNAFLPGEEHSEYFLKHTPNVNDVLLTVERFVRINPAIELDGITHEKELKRTPYHYELPGNVKTSYAPDGWFRVFVPAGDGKRSDEAFVLELDRASEDKRDQWWGKMRGLLAWRKNGYETQMGTDSLTVAVVCATGENRKDTPEGRLARRLKLIRWTEELLTEDKRRGDAAVFLFIDADPARLSQDEFFCTPLWYQPFGAAPVPLLATVEAFARAS
jgi:hypothetical protein